MVTIGLRVSPRRVTYAIVRGSPPDLYIVDVAALLVPVALTVPRQLQFVRTALLDIMEEYGTTRAGLRLAEATAQRHHSFRDNLEGVIQELLASSAVERFVTGRIATIARLLGERDRTIVKQMIEGAAAPLYAVQWSSWSPEEREAILVAAAASAMQELSEVTEAAE
jgi:hypothetical protein